jgi:hypothetical protein
LNQEFVEFPHHWNLSKGVREGHRGTFEYTLDSVSGEFKVIPGLQLTYSSAYAAGGNHLLSMRNKPKSYQQIL